MDKLPEIARQSSKSLDDLYAQARDSNDEFVQILSQVLNELQESKPDKFEGSHIKLAGIKNLKKAQDNVSRKFDGDASRSCDLVRATYIGKAETFDEFFESVNERMKIVAMKDRVARPNEFGYRDRKVNVALPGNGHVCEIQGLVQEIEDVRNETHPFREKANEISKRAVTENRLLTKEEEEEHHFLRMFCMSKHNDAAIKAGLNEKLDPTMPEDRLTELRTVNIPFLDFENMPAFQDDFEPFEEGQSARRDKMPYAEIEKDDDKLDI